MLLIRNADRTAMYRNIYLLTIIPLLLLIGCSGSSGGDTESETLGLNTFNETKEAPLVRDEEQGLIAGINLNENIEEEALITSNGEIEWTEGVDGKALLLDTDGEFLSIPDSDDLDLPGNGSVSVWIFQTEYTKFAGILHKGVKPNFSDEAWSLQFWGKDKPAIFFRNEEGKSKRLVSSEALELNKWHHIAATWGFDEADGKSRVRLYVDGEKKGELDISSFLPLFNSTGDLIIGSQLPEPYSEGKFGHITFRGAIDEILIYDRPLTEQEVTELYSQYSDL